MQPDLLGEHLAADVLNDDDQPDLLTPVGPYLSRGQWERALTVLTRAGSAHPHLDTRTRNLVIANPGTAGPVAVTIAIETQHPRPLLDALDTIADQADASTLRALADAIPQYTRLHRDLAGRVTAALVNHQRGATSDDHGGALARDLVHQSVRLAGLGRREDALAAIEEATTLYRGLAADRPDAFLPALATSLNNLSLDLAGLGRREDALAAIEEATTLRRRLATDRPAVFASALAQSLSNLADVFDALDRPGDAARVRDEAAHLRENPGR